ncbi:MAG: hypothetical protein Q7N87_03870 [Candidatus Uhrbacteria bacterium]|nr:hypothetical protein [Candidatus Uhrbacteria bacterium]
MKKSLYVVGGLVVLPVLVLFGAGCASPSEKIAEKLTEKALEKASGGAVKVDMNNKDGGVTITGKEGTFAMGGGGSRPESAPEDLPNAEGAKNFTWIGSTGSGLFSYEVADNDYRKVCKSQIELLLKAGWEKSDAYEMDVEKALTKTFVKPGFGLMVTCGDNTEENSTNYIVSVTLNKSSR